MLGNAAGEREEKGDENQRQSDDGQQDVAGEKRQIKRAQGRVGWVADVAVQSVMKNVADEKERGEGKGGEHGGTMGRDAVGADEGVADEEGDGAEAVERGVEGGKKCVAEAGCVGGGMEVDQPEEKGRGRRADGEDGGNSGAGAGRWGCGRHGFLAFAQSISAVKSRGR